MSSVKTSGFGVMAAMLFFSVDFVSLPRSVDALSLLMFVCLFVCLFEILLRATLSLRTQAGTCLLPRVNCDVAVTWRIPPSYRHMKLSELVLWYAVKFWVTLTGPNSR